jgi:hypothetical protein
MGRDGSRLSKQSRKLLLQSRADSFKCVHCKIEVPTKAVSTAHRNHCPLCLWSRHVDVCVGDRKSICLSSMEPIGLTIKRDGGELMIVHVCKGCGKISKNRISADDNDHAILNLFKTSLNISGGLRKRLSDNGINICIDIEQVKKIIGLS